MDIKRISLLSVVGILLLTMIGCGGKSAGVKRQQAKEAAGDS